VIVGSVPVLVLAIFAYLVSARALERLVNQGNDAAALITAALVEQEFEHWSATLASHGGFPTLAAAVTAGDVPEVRRRLQVMVQAHPRLDRAFVTDTTGLLWVDFPLAPESLGRRFDHRDWFRGVSSARAPYVSEVYRRHALPQLQVVAVATPVRAPGSQEVAGFLVAQVRLDGLNQLLRRVEVGEGGIVLLRDHTGALVAHPDPDLRDDRHEAEDSARSMTPTVPQGATRIRFIDPISQEAMLASAAAAHVGSHEWTVIAQQPARAAFAPIRGLAFRLGGAGLFMGVVMGALLWGVVQENTRRRRAERELRNLNRELERRVEERTAALRDREDQLLQSQKMEAVGRLAGGVAHDFNNLLTVIMGSAELLQAQLPAGSRAGVEVESISDAAERAADLTRQLLAFSRKQVMQPRVMDVNESVQRLRGILERVLGEDIQLVWRLRPDLHLVHFDPGQIEQVLMNLVVNARDAMPGGGKLIIETANVDLDEDHLGQYADAQPGPHVMLAVTDTGTGMDADTRTRIFEPFYTTKGIGKGTGLGLSTVYGIVRQGGGHVWVYSEPGRGTTFKVYLPSTKERRTAQDEAPVPSDPRGTGTILVVEDEDAVRDLVVRVLGDAGYTVLEAPDATTALEVFQDRPGIDLVLTDVILPDLRGPELVARLVAGQPDLRVLYMSGYADDALAHHGVLDAEIAFVPKPLRATTLLGKVREALTRQPS
jgi:signal transduction histidine kinase